MCLVSVCVYLVVRVNLMCMCVFSSYVCMSVPYVCVFASCVCVSVSYVYLCRYVCVCASHLYAAHVSGSCVCKFILCVCVSFASVYFICVCASSM